MTIQLRCAGCGRAIAYDADRVFEYEPLSEFRPERIEHFHTQCAQGMAPEGRGREGGPGSEELPSPVVADDAPKGESS